MEPEGDTSTAREVIRIENVWAGYNGTPVLEEINLSIKEDDFLGIIGPNGGGKTTLLKVILGLVQPSHGKIRVLGHTPEEGREFVGYVPQRTVFDQDFPICVWDVVLMGRARKAGWFRWYSKQDKDAASHALKTVGMLDCRRKQIGELSGGQQQRVLIARALTSDPTILLLDEPTASIDEPMQMELYELLGELKRKMTIVLVSHDIGAVSAHVDKIACVNRRLFYHNSKEITREDLEAVYQCPVEMIAHGVPHRVLKEH